MTARHRRPPSKIRAMINLMIGLTVALFLILGSAWAYMIVMH
jgi:hypothetical protein